MFDISLPVAFVAGITSFLAPCVVPLLPLYISFITGDAIPSKAVNKSKINLRVVWLTANFVIGFTTVFVILGATAASWGSVLRLYQGSLQQAGGLFIVILGIQQLGIIKIPWLTGEWNLIPHPLKTKLRGHAFLFGVLFAVTWSPCVGVVLGAIFTLAAVQATVLNGALLLFFYALGMSVPFILTSLGVIHITKKIRSQRMLHILQNLTGLLLIGMGILLLTDTYKYVNAFMFEIAFRLGYAIQ